MNAEPNLSNNSSSSSVLYLEQEKVEFITFDEIVSVFFKRWVVIIALTLLGLGLAALFHHYMLEDSYTSKAEISLASDGMAGQNDQDLSFCNRI